MSAFNIILLIIGILILVLGIVWSKKGWINMLLKVLMIFSGVYIVWYSLYLSAILIVINN